MASVGIESFKTSLLLVSALVILSSILVTAEDIVPLPPMLAPTHDYLENCGAKLHPVCGEEIRAAVFENGKVSDGCCKDLIAEGRACHDKFVQVIAPYYAKPARSQAPAKRARAWHACAAVAAKN